MCVLVLRFQKGLGPDEEYRKQETNPVGLLSGCEHIYVLGAPSKKMSL